MGKSDFEMNKGRNYARMREKESEGESERDRDRWIYEQIDRDGEIERGNKGDRETNTEINMQKDREIVFESACFTKDCDTVRV